MSRYDDPEVFARCGEIKKLALQLYQMQLDGQEMKLFLALSEIERQAHAAQVRMNDLLHKLGFKQPEEQMGT